jgi:predicted metal-dependent peptidase
MPKRGPRTVAERVTKARVDLLRQHYFYGALAMRLAVVEDAATETASVDGTTLRYNAEWIAGMPDAHLRAVIAHEVMHCAQRHVYRFGSRDHKKWNVATDYTINLQLLDAGMELPPDALVDQSFRHPQTGAPLAAEIVYARLPADPDDLPDHTGMGDMTPPPGEDQPEKDPQEGEEDQDTDGDGPAPGQSPTPGNSESDWDIAARAAESVCDKAGRMGADAARAMADSRRTRNSWRAELIDFIQRTKPDGYTWKRPNRRYVHQGMYYPGTLKEDFPPFAIVVDTSGSVDQATLDVFGAAVQEIVNEVRPEYVKVIYCDADVQGSETFAPDEPVELHAGGGGGTAFQPGLDAVTEAIESGEELAAALYVTDLYGPAPVEPDYPVLWVIAPASYHETGPFGRSVRLDPDE